MLPQNSETQKEEESQNKKGIQKQKKVETQWEKKTVKTKILKIAEMIWGQDQKWKNCNEKWKNKDDRQRGKTNNALKDRHRTYEKGT